MISHCKNIPDNGFSISLAYSFCKSKSTFKPAVSRYEISTKITDKNIILFLRDLTEVEGGVGPLRAPQNFKLPSKFRHLMG